MNEDIDNIIELRDQNPRPFEASDIDIDELIKTLRAKRQIDGQFLKHVQLGSEGVTSLTAQQAAAAFNALLDSDFYLHVNGDYLRLRAEIRRLLTLALEAKGKGFPIDSDILHTLNRALIHAVYPNETVKGRHFERFLVPEMIKMSVTISSLKALEPENHEGKILNVSAGGMALLLPKKLPDFTYWTLRIAFADHSEIETVVQIRHSMQQKDMFVHGFQFVSIPSFLQEEVENFARDFSQCEERIRDKAPTVCLQSCSLLAHCSKPQRRLAA